MSRGSRTDASLRDWRPGADRERLALRAEVLAGLRAWFSARGVMEVETPLLSPAGSSDPAIDSLETTLAGRSFFLHTSPEFAMKRLLAAGTGDIYQICRVFRAGEAGRRHNPEFTMLEYYRLGYDDRRLMDEVDELIRAVLGERQRLGPTVRLSYAAAMRRHAGIDPHGDATPALIDALWAADIDVPDSLVDDRDALLNLLLATVVEPRFDPSALTFLHDYPASQAALSRLRPGPPATAARFEVFLGGMEIANGFHELADAQEQGARFGQEARARAAAGRDCPPADRRLLAALAAGLPDCAGVAIGVDRLVMIAGGCETIDEALAFAIERA